MNSRQPSEDLFANTRMSFGEHLEELRKVLFRCMIWIGLGCVIGFLSANTVVRVLKQPLVDAMAEYNLANAAEELKADFGYVPPELLPWLEEEKFIPRKMHVDPAQLVAALQTVIPEFGETVQLEPYTFGPRDFYQNRLPQLATALAQHGKPDAQEAASIREQRTAKIWSLLTNAEQEAIQTLSSQSTATADDARRIAEVFNRLARTEALYNDDAFASEVSNNGSGVSSWTGETELRPLASMKAKLAETDDPRLARRLNRALLTQLFSADMPALKMELVPIELWESSEFEPQSLGVSETFMVWMKAGVLTGLMIAFPMIFYSLWSFVAAGLYPHEQKYVHIFLPISIGLFLAGVFLAFFFVFQPVLGFLFSFNRQMGIAPQMRINDWLSFVMFLPLGFGLAFQLPLVMLFMNRIGLFSVTDYLAKWRIAVMIIFVLAMLLTPADPISMLLLAIPLTILYFLGVAMCHWMPRDQNPFGESERKYTT